MATLAQLGFKPGWYRGTTASTDGSWENIVLTPISTNHGFKHRTEIQTHILATVGGQKMAFTYWYAGSDTSRVAYYEGSSFTGDDSSRHGRPRITDSGTGAVQVRSTQAGQEILVKVEIV